MINKQKPSPHFQREPGITSSGKKDGFEEFKEKSWRMRARRKKKRKTDSTACMDGENAGSFPLIYKIVAWVCVTAGIIQRQGYSSRRPARQTRHQNVTQRMQEGEHLTSGENTKLGQCYR